jgi:hypothetical protein
MTHLSIDTSSLALLDLSKAIQLRDVVFRCNGRSVHWVAATLRTAKRNTLQSISMVITLKVIRYALIFGAAHQGWGAVDQQLMQFWSSNSIRPKLLCRRVEMDKGLKSHVGGLLPESTREGIVDMVEHGRDG